MLTFNKVLNFLLPKVYSFGPLAALGIGVGGSLLGGLIGSKGSKDAAQIGADASGRALQWDKEMYGDIKDMYSDYRGRGGEAFNQLASYGRSPIDPSQYIPQSNIPEFDSQGFNMDFWKDPSYEWRKEEQLRGIDRTAGATGKVTSGNRMDEIMRRSGDMASQEYPAAFGRYKDQYNADKMRESEQYGRGVDDFGRAYGMEGDYLNRLAGLSDYGFNAVSGLGKTGTQMSTNITNSMMNMGNAQAAGRLGEANAWGGAVRDIATIAGRELPRYNNQPQPDINYSPAPQTSYQDFYW